MNMDLIEQFEKEVKERIDANANDEELKRLAAEWMRASMLKKYAYNFSWLGRPIIQTPQDIVALQEITWKAKPDFIVDVGIAHGGSLILYASLLDMIGKGEVVGI